MWINRWSMIGKTRVNYADVPSGYVLDCSAFANTTWPHNRCVWYVCVNLFSVLAEKNPQWSLQGQMPRETACIHTEVFLLVFGLVQADLHKPKQRRSLKLREITSCSTSSQLRQSSTGSADVGKHFRQVPLCLLKEEDWFSGGKMKHIVGCRSVFIW